MSKLINKAFEVLRAEQKTFLLVVDESQMEEQAEKMLKDHLVKKAYGFIRAGLNYHKCSMDNHLKLYTTLKETCVTCDYELDYLQIKRIIKNIVKNQKSISDISEKQAIEQFERDGF